MKNPESALPWFYDGNFDGTVTTPGDYVFQDCLKEDAEYIVQACNNFPKAVELLKANRMFGSTANIKAINEFLDSLE